MGKPHGSSPGKATGYPGYRVLSPLVEYITRLVTLLLFGGYLIIFRLFAFRGLTDQKGRIYTTQH